MENNENSPESTEAPANATPLNITLLSVPYEEKDAAKALGARWHGKKQRWFAPEDADLSLFERWRIAKDTQHTTTNDKGEKPTINTLEKIDPRPKPETAPIPQSKNAPGTVVKTAPTPEPSPAPTPESMQESAPTIPEALNRYYRILGNTKKAQYFFQGQPDVEAFRDKGRKMITKHDGPKIAQSMVELAEAKGWSNLKVSGSEQFRRTVWLAAQERDMTVTGYTPTTQDLENAQLKKNTIESDNSPTQAPDTQPEPEEAKAAGPQEVPLEAPSVARSEPPGTHPGSTEPPPGVGATSDFTEPAKHQQAPSQAQANQPDTAPPATDPYTRPINYAVKAALREAYLTRDKKEAIAEFPQLEPVYAFEQAASDFVAGNKRQFSPGTDNMFVERIRENALDVLARGETLPDRLPPLSAPPKAPKNDRSNDMELEL